MGEKNETGFLIHILVYGDLVNRDMVYFGSHCPIYKEWLSDENILDLYDLMSEIFCEEALFV